MNPITQGKDFNFFTKFTVSDITFPSKAQIVFNFKNQSGFSLVNEGNVVIQYSFNGHTLHGDLTPGTPTAAMIFDQRRVPAIWFQASGASAVRVEAWAGV